MVTHYIPSSGMKGSDGCLGMVVFVMIIIAIGVGMLFWVDWALRSVEAVRP